MLMLKGGRIPLTATALGVFRYPLERALNRRARNALAQPAPPTPNCHADEGQHRLFTPEKVLRPRLQR